MPADGLDTLSVTFTPTDTTDYTMATATVVLTVGDFFTLDVSGAGSDETGNGGSASYRFEVTPGVSPAKLPGAVAFSVTGLPPGATATFTPITIPAGSGAKFVTLRIKTEKVTVGNARGPVRSAAPTALGILLLPMLGLLFAGKGAKWIPQRLVVALLAMLSLGAAIGLTSCAGTVTPSNPITFTVVLTATSGNLQHSTNLTLIVNE